MNEYTYRYTDDASLLVINSSGALRRLYVPFRVRCIERINDIPEGSWVVVEAVSQDSSKKLLFLIQGRLTAYDHFHIQIQF